MKPVTRNHNYDLRHRRIGRKVLLADRLSHAVDNETKGGVKDRLLGLFGSPKKAAFICGVILVIGAVTFTGSRLYGDQVAAAQKIEVANEQRELKQKSEAADACRRQKVEQKAELIGKVTYDELYDGNECDR